MNAQHLETRRVLAGGLSVTSEPIEVFQDRDGVVYLLESADPTGPWATEPVSQLHRWSTELDSRLPSLELSGSATDAVISDDRSDLYVGYANGKVTRIDLIDGLFAEEDVFVSPGEIDDLFVAGDWILTVIHQYAKRLLDVRDSIGNRIAFFDLGQSETFSYDADRRRLYSLEYGRVQVLQLGLFGETGHWSDASGAYSNTDELVVSPDGSWIVAGNGYLYTSEPLAFDTSLVSSFDKAAWISNEQVISLRSFTGGTKVRQSSATSLQQLRETRVDGAPLAVFPRDDAATIVTYASHEVLFHDLDPFAYLDIDLDGVPLGEDAFPNDAAASVDTDHDGYPDVWNDGKDRSDSTTNLYLDSHPNDSACGHPLIDVVDCDAVRQAVKVAVNRSTSFVDEAGILYHGNDYGTRIYRYSIHDQRYLNPIVLSDERGRPDEIVLSLANQRIYLLYQPSAWQGEVTQIDYRQEYPAEMPFATIRSSAGGLNAVGEFVIVGAVENGNDSNFIFDSSGNVVSTKRGQRLRNVVWRPTENFFYHGSSEIRRQDFDLQTGQFGTDVRLTFRAGSPIAVSPDGRYLLGTKAVIDLDDTSEIDLFDSAIFGVWLDDGTLVASNDSQLRQWDGQFHLVDAVDRIANRGIVQYGDQIFVLAAGQSLRRYELTDDKDGDGFTTFEDAFPYDPAASVDTDGDRYPDSWNVGKDAADSTTGLRLDAFPDLQVCFLPEHGLPADLGVCDIASTIHGSVPRQVRRGPDATVLLLDPANDRLHVWSTTVQDYVASYQFATRVSAFAVSDDQPTAYVGASDGTLYTIDLSLPTSRPIEFATIDESIKSLALVGDYVVALGENSLYSLHRNTPTGQLAGSHRGFRLDSTLIVDSTRSAVYLADAGNGSRESLAVNQETGAFSRMQGVSSQGLAPLAFSADGQQMIDKAGVLYEWNDIDQQFRCKAFLPVRPDRAVWIDDRHVVTLRASATGATVVETWNDQLQRVDLRYVVGTSVGLVRSDGAWTIVTLAGGETRFYRYELSTDFDGDGVETVDDAFPIDARASVDTDADGAPDALHGEPISGGVGNGNLVVDAFPNHSACQTIADAVRGHVDVCDVEAAVGKFSVTDSAVDGDGVVYLLDQQGNRILRRETTTGAYLDPILLEAKLGNGIPHAGSTLAPLHLAYAAERHWLLIGYAKEIVVIDLSESIRIQKRWFQSDEFIGDMAIYGDRLFLSPFSTPVRTIDLNGSPPVVPLRINARSFLNFDPATERLYYTSGYNTVYGSQVRSVTFDPQSGDVSDSIVVDDATQLGRYRFGIGINSPDGRRTVFPGGGVIDLATFDLLGVVKDWSHGQARWIDNETIVTARGLQGTTHVEVWNVSGELLDQREFAGDVRELAVVGNQVALVTDVDSLTQFHFTTWSPDRDGDGVENRDDHFPDDVAASVDSDHDKAPDHWNQGLDADDSTTGLRLDAFPLDSACQTVSQASPGDPARCELDRTPIDFQIADTAFDSNGLLYLLDAVGGAIHRWDSTENQFLNPLIVDGARRIEIHHASQRLLVGDADGRLLGYDLGSELPVQRVLQPFGRTDYGIASYGDLIRVQGTHGFYLVDGAGDAQRVTTFRDGVWNDVASTWTYLDGDSLVVAQADPQTDQTVGTSRSPRDRSFRHPVTVSPSGSYVLMGSGHVFAASDLSAPLKMIHEHDDAVLFDDATAVVLRTSQSDAVIQWHHSEFGLVDEVAVDATARRLIAIGDQALLVSEKDGRLHLKQLTLREDSDDDGRTYHEDAFPLDASISVDADGDGYPDAWHDGYVQSFITPDLHLDAFVDDHHCSRESERIFGQDYCVAGFVSEAVQSDGGNIVYLLDATRRLVHRWSASEQDYLKPLRLAESDRGRPTALGADVERNRLLVGYQTGQVTQIDLSRQVPEETLVTTILGYHDLGVPVTTLIAQPEFLYVVAGNHYTFDGDGTLIDVAVSVNEQVLPAFDAGWILNLDLRGTVGHDQPVVRSVDRIQVSPQGQIGYKSEVDWQDPIAAGEWLRLSPNRQLLFSQRGDVWNVGFQVAFRNALPAEEFRDAVWLGDQVLATIRSADGDRTVAEHWTANGELLYRQVFRGNPLSVQRTGADTVVLIERAGTVVVHPFVLPQGSSVGSIVLPVGTETAVAFDMTIAHGIDVPLVYRVEVAVSGTTRSAADGEPVELAMVDLDGRPVESIVDSSVDTSDETEGLTRLVVLRPGRYSLTVRSAHPLGKVRVNVAIDAASGDSAHRRLLVEKAEALILSKAFTVSPVLRANYERRLGASLDVIAKDPMLDQNANGWVDFADLMALRTNFEAATEVVWAELGESIEMGEPPGPLRERELSDVTLGDLSLPLLTNSAFSTDVDNSGAVTPYDALLVINQLARVGSGEFDFSKFPFAPAAAAESLPPHLVDVNGDRRISPLDVLLIVNDLARRNGVLGERAETPSGAADAMTDVLDRGSDWNDNDSDAIRRDDEATLW